MAKPAKYAQALVSVIVLIGVFLAIAAAFQQVYNAAVVPVSADPETEIPRIAKIQYLTSVLLLMVVPLFLLGGTAFVTSVVAALGAVPATKLKLW
uniref:Transmembrane protein n=1 Tax=Marseillevirus LCMAC103 TaxID=2506604 RepID=A0A481YWQ5_9VIRU|nr:MAG: hypothetical protein LCMAC103_03380 [Marseillevirus LCMAC103]